jgi:hypothetical protein
VNNTLFLSCQLSTDEYNALKVKLISDNYQYFMFTSPVKEAALELADDAGLLLEQFYQLDRTKESPGYQLLANRGYQGKSKN